MFFTNSAGAFVSFVSSRRIYANPHIQEKVKPSGQSRRGLQLSCLAASGVFVTEVLLFAQFVAGEQADC
jgi:hypothetical protein